METPTTPTIQAIGPSSTGALAGFEATCSCGLVMRNSLRVSIEIDVRDHVAYHEARAYKNRKAR